MAKVWSVDYWDWDEHDVDSIWSTLEAAEARAEELSKKYGPWEVTEFDLDTPEGAKPYWV